MRQEILRRINILKNKKLPVLTKRDLRGGMQKRVHRQEAKRYSDEINSKIKRLQTKLSSLEDKDNFTFGGSSFELEEFDEPVFKKIRNKRGFF